MKNPLDYVAPVTRVRRSARREAAAFAASVIQGHTYYSIVNNHAHYHGAPAQLLMTWVFSKPGRWIGQDARCGSVTAVGAWLGYGPLHKSRPAGLMTFAESARVGVAGPLESRNLVPAGV